MTERTKTTIRAAIILAGIASAPFLPDNLVPAYVYKAALGGATGGLVAAVVCHFLKDEPRE